MNRLQVDLREVTFFVRVSVVTNSGANEKPHTITLKLANKEVRSIDTIQRRTVMFHTREDKSIKDYFLE